MAQQQKQAKGGVKLRRGSKHNAMYERQRMRGASRKLAHSRRRIERKARWVKLAIKKNGERVKGVEDKAYVEALRLRNQLAATKGQQ